MDSVETSIYFFLTATCVVIACLFVYLAYVFIRKHNQRNTIQQQSLRTELNMLQEERRRIGANLHDEITPVLILAFRQLEAVKNDPENYIKDDMLDKVCKNLQNTIPRMNGILFDLLDDRIINNGLENSIRGFLRQYVQLYGIKKQLTYNVTSPLKNEIVMELYRIIQEIINNSIKHGRASYISMYIKEKKKVLYIVYIDNSSATPAENTAGSTGQGLHNIYTRVELLGGEMVRNENNNNSYIIEIPLDAEKLIK